VSHVQWHSRQDGWDPRSTLWRHSAMRSAHTGDRSAFRHIGSARRGSSAPTRLGRQRDRKHILALDGSDAADEAAGGWGAGQGAGPWRWQKLLDVGVDSSVTEIAAAEKISKSYVSRILRLALLAPDIVEAILGGWADQRVMLEQLERPLPVGWERQRAVIVRRP
jgi:hypothetical protein